MVENIATLSQETGTSSLRSTLELTRGFLNRLDSHMRAVRQVTVLLQLIHLVLLLMIPPLAYLLRNSEALILTITLVCALVGVVGVYQSFVNPQLRWAKYDLVRKRVQKLLLESELLFHSPEAKSNEDVTRLTDQIRLALDLELTLWSAEGMSDLHVPVPEETRAS